MALQSGVLYVATGSLYLDEAANSSIASRPFLVGRPIAVVTDLVERAKDLNAFDIVLPHLDPKLTYRDKISPLEYPPFQSTLFLDSDARLTASAESLFSCLGSSHIAAAHAPVRQPSGWCDHSVPSLFPELNSGVLLLRRCWRQRLLIRRWLYLYDKLFHDFDQAWDQASLRSVVWALQQNRGLRLAILPPEANLRTTKPWIAGKGLAVHVVHGRVPHSEWTALIDYCNGDLNRFRHWHEWLERNPDSMIRPKLPPNPV